MRALRTIKLLREYILDRCFSEDDNFIRLFDLIFECLQKGMLNSVKEIQVEPSISVSKNKFNSKRYTVLINKCLCKDCGDKNYFWNNLTEVLKELNVPDDIFLWINNSINIYEKSQSKINYYLSIDFSEKENIRTKTYFEQVDDTFNIMPFYNETGNRLRVKPDIVSTEWNNDEKKIRFYNAINVKPNTLDIFLKNWFEKSDHNQKDKIINILKNLIGKRFCMNKVHLYETDKNVKRVLFCLKCECEQFSNEEKIIDSNLKRIYNYLIELSKFYHWPNDFNNWLQKAKNDHLSWIGFNKDLDNLELVIYYNDTSFIRRKETDFTSFSKVGGNNILGKYIVHKNNYQSSVLLEHIFDVNKYNSKFYRYLHNLIYINGLNNTLWLSKFDSNEKLISNSVGINHLNNDIVNLTKEYLNYEVFPFSNDFMYYFFNLESQENSKLSLVYQEGPFNQLPNGSIYDYDGVETYPKLKYKIFPGGRVSENNINFNGLLKKIIEFDSSISESIKNCLYFGIIDDNLNTNISLIFTGVNYDITISSLKNKIPNLCKYLIKKRENFDKNDYNYGFKFNVSNSDLIEFKQTYLLGTL